jgi:protein-S-isoprenylcysteine O-methyltransferase Ste14
MGSILRYLYKHDPALLERRAAIPALLIVPFLMFRIKHEEAQMLAELEGYREYTQKVRCRLFPGIW